MIVEVDSLVKSYGGVRVVDGISFSVEAGETFGLLGPNGAGKTTTVEMIEGLRTSDGGSIRIAGYDLNSHLAEVKEIIGVQLQAAAFLPNLTVWETLAMFGSFYRKAVHPDLLIDELGLQEKRKAQVKGLSGGQKQRLSVALALVNEPDLVFLDEPTTGMDPQARRSLWDLIKVLRDKGKTVILTTHYMEEAQELCDRVAIMDHGRFLELDGPDNLIKRHFKERAIQFEAGEAAQKVLLGLDLPSVTQTSVEDGTVTMYSENMQEVLTAIMRTSDELNLSLSDVTIRKATLEDVFLKLTGRRIRD